MKKACLSFILLVSTATMLVAQSPVIQGEFVKWHTLRLLFDGPQCSETDFSPNPFLDYRLEVTFTNGNKKYKVPGFFAADGNSSETGAIAGNKWQVNFVADEAGKWNYSVSFRSGKDIAISDQPAEGKAIAPNDASGTFTITATDKSAPGFLSKGRVEVVGERYLKFRETGTYFLKNGADSPERIFLPTSTLIRLIDMVIKPSSAKAKPIPKKVAIVTNRTSKTGRPEIQPGLTVRVRESLVLSITWHPRV